MRMMYNERASFRDPAGFVFSQNNKIYRKVIDVDNYSLLMKSGLYDRLVQEDKLIPHRECGDNIIEPEQIKFISYSYEWCFSQLKDAALITLNIQKAALEKGMILKDASAYNIQFIRGKPILIDTLSLCKYEDNSPWYAYKQFCQHFLAPLSLMAHKDVRLQSLLRNYIDGIPLDLTSSILPLSTMLNFSLLTHIHINSYGQKKYDNKGEKISQYKIDKQRLIYIIDNLISSVKSMKLSGKYYKQKISDYYTYTNYDDVAFRDKKNIVARFVGSVSPDSICDYGSNTGEFSKDLTVKNIVCLDADHDSIDYLYRERKSNILPLMMDLSNVSPSIGWNLEERKDFRSRFKVDLALSLALVHHLAISNNLPFSLISLFFRDMCKFLIIEWIPRDDSQVQSLLSSGREASHYNENNFMLSFLKDFSLIERCPIENSKRILFLLKGRNS